MNSNYATSAAYRIFPIHYSLFIILSFDSVQANCWQRHSMYAVRIPITETNVREVSVNVPQRYGHEQGCPGACLAEPVEPFHRQARSVQSTASAALGKSPWRSFVDGMKTWLCETQYGVLQKISAYRNFPLGQSNKFYGLGFRERNKSERTVAIWNVRSQWNSLGTV